MQGDKHGSLSVRHRGHGPPRPNWVVLISRDPDGRDIRTRVEQNETIYACKSRSRQKYMVFCLLVH